MANSVLDKGYRVTTAIAIFRCVMPVTDDWSVKQADSAGAAVLGICQETVDATDGTNAKRIVNIRLEGVSKAVAGAAIANGAPVMTTNVGKVITATSTNKIVGYARSTAAADGDWIDVELVGKGSVLA